MDKELEVKNSTKKMIMYFIVFSITMLFGGLVSAYIVSSLGQYWVHISPPTIFWVSNALLILSSITLYISIKSIREGIERNAKALLLATLLLGVGFTAAQINGWKKLKEWGLGWRIQQTDLGEATSWNRIENLIEGSAVYGVDYDIRIDGEALLYNSETKELFAPNDPLMVKPISNKVAYITNSSSAYLWVLVWVHILHLSFGLAYLLVNISRLNSGKINKENYIQLETLGTYWHFLGGLWLVLFFMLFSV